MKMDEVIGDLCLESLIEFIQTQVFGCDNGNIFICAKMRQGSRFVGWGMTLKKGVFTHSINSAGDTPNLAASFLIWFRVSCL